MTVLATPFFDSVTEVSLVTCSRCNKEVDAETASRNHVTNHIPRVRLFCGWICQDCNIKQRELRNL